MFSLINRTNASQRIAAAATACALLMAVDLILPPIADVLAAVVILYCFVREA